MKKELIVVSRLSSDDTIFLCRKTFRRILQNEDKLTKGQICDTLRNLEGTLNQYS